MISQEEVNHHPRLHQKLFSILLSLPLIKRSTATNYFQARHDRLCCHQLRRFYFLHFFIFRFSNFPQTSKQVPRALQHPNHFYHGWIGVVHFFLDFSKIFVLFRKATHPPWSRNFWRCATAFTVKKNGKMLLRLLLIGLSLIIVIERCNGEVNNATRKCDEGWQGKDCEFCAGKIR